MPFFGELLHREATDARRGDLCELLRNEAKLLQGKVDKIGGFRFTIKGWTVTLLAAAAAAIASGGSHSLSLAVLIASGTCLLVFAFHRLEYEQVRLSRIYTERIGRIENAHHRLQANHYTPFDLHFKTPWTAQDVVKKQKYKEGLLASISNGYRQAHGHFYLLLCVLTVAMLIPNRGLIQKLNISAKWSAVLRELSVMSKHINGAKEAKSVLVQKTSN